MRNAGSLNNIEYKTQSNSTIGLRAHSVTTGQTETPNLSEHSYRRNSTVSLPASPPLAPQPTGQATGQPTGAAYRVSLPVSLSASLPASLSASLPESTSRSAKSTADTVCGCRLRLAQRSNPKMNRRMRAMAPPKRCGSMWPADHEWDSCACIESKREW